jgi:Ca2+-binding RTX toxin-like protein
LFDLCERGGDPEVVARRLLALAAVATACTVSVALAARIVGTDRSDVLRGTAAADTILGKAGNDRILGGAGNDTLYGGPGNDTLSGGPGNDAIWGGPGDDRITAGPGKDRVLCGPGRDRVSADALDLVAKDCETVSRPPVAPPPAPPPPPDPLASGKQVFLSAGCGGCHTLADAGTTGTVGPNLDAARPSKDKVIERVTNGRGPMPSFASLLSAQEIDDVATYVSTVAGR